MRFRRATASDSWINGRYAEVDFLPSDFEREIVLIAEDALPFSPSDGEKDVLPFSPSDGEKVAEGRMRGEAIDAAPHPPLRGTLSPQAGRGGMAIGVGRLVPIDDETCELGGMLVFEPFRGRGIARALIDELLEHANGREVYCLPFAELEKLYASAGFVRTDTAPHEIMKKWEWCKRTYPNEVLLMRHQR